MSRFYDRAGQPISLQEWQVQYTPHNKRVALTEKDGVEVSTVWLGIDHQYGDGPPLIFETMIFGGKDEGYQERYSTEEEARAGHEVACRVAFGEEA